MYVKPQPPFDQDEIARRRAAVLENGEMLSDQGVRTEIFGSLWSLISFRRLTQNPTTRIIAVAFARLVVVFKGMKAHGVAADNVTE